MIKLPDISDMCISSQRYIIEMAKTFKTQEEFDLFWENLNTPKDDEWYY